MESEGRSERVSVGIQLALAPIRLELGQFVVDPDIIERSSLGDGIPECNAIVAGANLQCPLFDLGQQLMVGCVHT